MKIYLPNLVPTMDVVDRWAVLLERLGHDVDVDVSEADLVLFVEAHLLGDHPLLPPIMRHPAWKTTPERCFVYDERDLPLGHLPGAYVSLPSRRHGPGRVASAYYSGGVAEAVPARSTPPQLLYSFMGSRSHPVRGPVLELVDDRAHIEDTSGFVFYDPSQSDFDHRRAQFDAVLANSKFVLCPRGRGTSSIRSYETLQRGRVPVIIADDWEAPPGPAWDEVSLRVAERDVRHLPRILRENESRWEQMSLAAVDAYETHFTPLRVADHVVTSVAGMSRTTGPLVTRSATALTLMRHRADQVKRGVRRRAAGAKRFLRGAER